MGGNFTGVDIFLERLKQKKEKKRGKKSKKPNKKEKTKNPKDKRIDSIIKKSKTGNELINSIKCELIKKMTEEYNQIRDEICYLRKKGKDTYMEDIKSMMIPL